MTDYDASLNEIYASFMAAKDVVEGRHDRDVREPQRVLQIARELGLLPDSERTIRVTGSKGKGTTARLSAAALAAARPEAKVGLFVSPEEFDHVDRMRIDGRPIDHASFVRIQRLIAAALAPSMRKLTGPAYVSPLGYFLLIALSWFAEQKVDLLVLECGRGAEFDEVGQIPSKVAVVTSILLEHPRQLGPTIKDIARNKFSISRESKTTITSLQASGFVSDLPSVPSDLRVVAANPSSAGLPAWIEEDDALARAAVKALLGLNDEQAVRLSYQLDTSSFGRVSHENIEVIFEAAINAESLDLHYLRGLAARHDVHVIVSLPDDKDRAQLLTTLSDVFGQVWEVALTGTRGYLHYGEALKHSSTWQIDHLDQSQLNTKIKNLELKDGDTLYFLGTQTFIRLVRNWLQAQ